MALKIGPKATPKLDQKWLQKGTQFWAPLGPILGVILGTSWLSAVRPLDAKMAPNSEIFVFFLQPNISLNSEIFLVDVNTA